MVVRFRSRASWVTVSNRAVTVAGPSGKPRRPIREAPPRRKESAMALLLGADKSNHRVAGIELAAAVNDS